VASFCRLPISGLLKNERNRLLRARQQLTERLAKKREITKLLILRVQKVVPQKRPARCAWLYSVELWEINVKLRRRGVNAGFVLSCSGHRRDESFQAMANRSLRGKLIDELNSS